MFIEDRFFAESDSRWKERELAKLTGPAEFRRKYLGEPVEPTLSAFDSAVAELYDDEMERVVRRTPSLYEGIDRTKALPLAKPSKPEPKPVAALSRFAVLDFGDEK